MVPWGCFIAFSAWGHGLGKGTVLLPATSQQVSCSWGHPPGVPQREGHCWSLGSHRPQSSAHLQHCARSGSGGPAWEGIWVDQQVFRFVLSPASKRCLSH